MNTAKYEVLEGIVLALLILVRGVFSEQYKTGSAAICSKSNTNPLVHLRVFCSMDNMTPYGLSYPFLTQINYSQLFLASFFSLSVFFLSPQTLLSLGLKQVLDPTYLVICVVELGLYISKQALLFSDILFFLHSLHFKSC